MALAWCDVCRGDKDGPWIKCGAKDCRRLFHPGCLMPDDHHEAKAAKATARANAWRCADCKTQTDFMAQLGKDDLKAEKAAARATKARSASIRGEHRAMRLRRKSLFAAQAAELEPFIGAEGVADLVAGAGEVAEGDQGVPDLPRKPAYVHADLRQYQVEGVQWMLERYRLGAGGILGDEMGLGKTIQSLAFLAHLKASGFSGPSLVVTPLAVLQNWVNEMRRFTPSLTFAKVAGSRQERQRALSDPKTASGDVDVILTTYETIVTEEAFFADSFPYLTIVIDEGHRLKNDSCKLMGSLHRIEAPFRLLLTGTPLQNNMRELWALLSFIVPEALAGEHVGEIFQSAFSFGSGGEGGGMGDATTITAARSLLDTMMLRRIKADVVSELPAKISTTLMVPMCPAQKELYASFLANAGAHLEMLTQAQAQGVFTQLSKICNHPKQLLKAVDVQRAADASKARRAQGAEFIKVHSVETLGPNGAALEAGLRGMAGPSLLTSSNKLALLDKLLVRLRDCGSRALIFSQWTAALDVLEEYMAWRFGPKGHAFLRLDGDTNRINREMDTRAFNAAGSPTFAYLISTRAGGQGLNLATADSVVLFDSSWNPQIDLQAQDRAHRIGQRRQVHVYRLATEKTVEERIIARAQQKMMLDRAVVQHHADGGADAALAAARMVQEDTNHDEEVDGASTRELVDMLKFGKKEVFSRASAVHRELTDEELDSLVERSQSGGMQRVPIPDSAAAAAAEEEEEMEDEGHQGGASRGAVAPEQHWDPAQQSWKRLADCVEAMGGLPGQVVIVLRRERRPMTVAEMAAALSSAPEGTGSVISAPALLAALTPSDLTANPWSAVFHQAASAAQGDPGSGVWGLREWRAGEPPPLSSVLKRMRTGAKYQSLTERLQLEASAFAGVDVACEADKENEGKSQRLGGGSRRRQPKPTRKFEPVDYRELGPTRPTKAAKLKHDGFCFECAVDGGEILMCSVCPRSYHLPCAGFTKAPRGLFRCQWHWCHTCGRSSSQSGGVLLHCAQCPVAFCLDCCPESYLSDRKADEDAARRRALLAKGMVDAPATPGHFFTCERCAHEGNTLVAAEAKVLRLGAPGVSAAAAKEEEEDAAEEWEEHHPGNGKSIGKKNGNGKNKKSAVLCSLCGHQGHSRSACPARSGTKGAKKDLHQASTITPWLNNHGNKKQPMELPDLLGSASPGKILDLYK